MKDLNNSEFSSQNNIKSQITSKAPNKVSFDEENKT